MCSYRESVFLKGRFPNTHIQNHTPADGQGKRLWQGRLHSASAIPKSGTTAFLQSCPQSLPVHASCVKPLPVHPSSPQPLPAHPSFLQPLPAHTSFPQPLPAHRSCPQPLPAHPSCQQSLPALQLPLPAHPSCPQLGRKGSNIDFMYYCLNYLCIHSLIHSGTGDGTQGLTRGRQPGLHQ